MFRFIHPVIVWLWLLLMVNVSFGQAAWVTLSPSPTAANLSDVVWGDSQFVAVGSDGTVLTSSDGAKWSVRLAKTSGLLNKVIWTGKQYVAVGSAGVIVTSENGINWTARVSNSARDLLSVAWTGSKLVVVGSLGTVLTSPDGIAWTAQPLACNQCYLRSVVWTGAQLVAGGYSTTGTGSSLILTSPDGTAWTAHSAGAITIINDLAWTGSRLVAVGYFGLTTSPDAIVWTLNSSVTYGLNKVVWTGSQLVAVGIRSQYQNSIFTSPDGLAWTYRPTDNMESLFGVASNGKTLVAVGIVGTILSSGDGISWVARSTGIARDLADVAWSGHLLAAVGRDNMIATSVNGTVWTPRSCGFMQSFHSIIWADTQFVASSDNYTVTSADGVNWRLRTRDGNGFSAMVYANKRIIGAGIKGIIKTSPDGQVWTPCTSNVTVDLRGIVSNGQRLVVVGDSGVVLTSTDGNVWQKQIPDSLIDLWTVAWGGGKFIAAGASDTVLVSPDGAVWSAHATGMGGFYEIVWTGRQFVAQNNGEIFSSSDGVNWSKRTSGIRGSALVWQANTLVLVGASGEIKISPEDIVAVEDSRPVLSARSTRALSVSLSDRQLFISYVVERPAALSIGLVDLSGRRIFSAVDKSNQAGTRSIRVPLHNLAAGAYYLILKSESARECRMVVIE
ncbi:MAG: hypothetical protein PHE24_02420 [Patescibacteria group bacterium]|nr:hypothetical protein [Patescibacteria group bacterium]